MNDPRNFDAQVKELERLVIAVIPARLHGISSVDRAVRIWRQATYHALEAAYNAGADDVKSGRLII